MAFYAELHKGKVVHPCFESENPPADFGDFITYREVAQESPPQIGQSWNENTNSWYDPAPEPSGPRWITKHDFFVRFPAVMRKYIANPFQYVGDGLTQPQAVQISVFSFSANISGAIDLNLQETTDAMAWFVSEGLMTQAEADAVLV